MISENEIKIYIREGTRTPLLKTFGQGQGSLYQIMPVTLAYFQIELWMESYTIQRANPE